MTKKVYVLRRNSGQGGAEKAAERLAFQLSLNFDVERMWAGRDFLGYAIPGVSGSAWWRSWRYTRFVDRLKLKKRGQLVLSLEYGPNCDIYRAGDGVHRLNVLRRYGNRKGWMANPWHWFAPKQERKCLESAKVIVANSYLVEKLIQVEYPHLSHKTMTIYNGYDPAIYRLSDIPKVALRRQLGVPEKGVMLLLSGHGFLRKGLHHAISILDELVGNLGVEAFLCVAGKGESGYVTTQITEAKLQGRIHFLGSVTGIERYYQAADFMVLPTRHDPFSNSCLEALACGCPVVTSNQNGAAEVLTDEAGFVMDATFDRSELQSAARFISAFKCDSERVASTVKGLTQADEIKAYNNLIDKLFSQQDGNE
jgi:UDP-glucose:(heptosyl)LPS alpha-1,3-glucosyltransferase